MGWGVVVMGGEVGAWLYVIVWNVEWWYGMKCWGA